MNIDNSFLASAHQGKNNGWMYCATVLTIVGFWYLLSGYIAWAWQLGLSLISKFNYINYFVATSIPFIIILTILFISIERIHCRNIYSLINNDAKINIRRLVLGFGVWGLQQVVFTGIDILSYSRNYTWNFDVWQWFTLLPLVVLLTPIQTSVEELFYRGYLLQGLSLKTTNIPAIVLYTSLLFALPHLGNPEMQRGFTWVALNYFASGIFYAAIALKDRGLELSLGVHAANNIFSFLFVSTPDSVAPTPAMFLFTKPIDAREGFFSFLIQAGIFYAILFGGIPRTNK
jgi:uncharacterized protein